MKYYLLIRINYEIAVMPAKSIPRMFYIPPLSPVVSVVEEDLVRLDLLDEQRDFELFHRLYAARLPVKYLANLLAAGNEDEIRPVLLKMLAVRIYMRRKSVAGEMDEETLKILGEVGIGPQEAEAIYRLTTLPTLEERFVLPPYHREMSVEAWKDPLAHKGETGLGYLQIPLRGE